MEAGRVDDAIDFLHEASLLPLGWGNIIDFDLGFALTKMGRWKEAIAAFRKATERDVQYPAQLHITLGELLTTTGRTDEVAAHYR